MHYSPIEDRTSCTRDEAISIMLGLGQFRYMPLKDDATHEEIESLRSMTFSLLEYLYEELASLESEYAEAKFDKLSADIIAEKLAALRQFKELMDKAREYSCSFDDEVAKGESSAIRIHETGSLGEKQYTLNSLRQWVANNKYGISMAAAENNPEPQRRPPSGIETDIAKKQNQPKEQKLRAQEKAILGEIVRLGHDPKNLPKNIAGKPGVKAEVRKSLKENDMFTGMKVFDKAWERLRNFGDIANLK